MRLLLFLFLVTGFHPSGFTQPVVSMKSLLAEMTDFASVTRWPLYSEKQASSYDRRSVSPDKPGWFANSDFNQFIREEKKQDHTEYVMMDADGPGAIVRFWLTTVVKPGKIRFYFDNEETPSIEIPAFDLMKAGFNLGPALLNPHSSYDPADKGGNTLYLPLPYQKHCKVTWEYADTATMKTSHYYQINYRTYPAGTEVQTFTRSDLVADRKAINEAEAALWHPPAFKNGKQVSLSQKIGAGRLATCHLPPGGAAIRMLDLKIKTKNKTEYEKAWRSVILKIVFDGEETVNAPVGDFIGSGDGGKVIKSWYRELGEDGHLISRWVMPYRKSAKISIINKAGFEVDADLKITISSFKWDNRTMYFHTTYKSEKNIRDVSSDYDVNKTAALDTAGPIEWNFVSIKGKGIYLGNTLAVYNHMNAWYGEGDEKAYVNGEKFPSEFGTGLEDTYNTSWAPVVLYQSPFANAPRADNPSSFGHNSFTRTRNLDGIPFSSSFRYNMEMLSWTGGTVDCSATTYWYAFRGATDRN